MERKVAIIGAGITGLSAAYYIEQRAREQNKPISCTLIDAADRLGGKVVTAYDQDFIIEGGPDSFVTDKPWCIQLCHELGLSEMLLPNNQLENKVYVLHHGRLLQFPSGFRLSIPTKFKPFLFTPLISPIGKLRMAMEYFLPPRPSDDDESLGQFMGRRLGREAVETIAGPLMAGIFVSDPDRLSMKGTFPSFIEMEKKYGSLIKAVRAYGKNPPKRTGPAAAGNSMFNSLKGGMATLIDAIAKVLTGTILLGTRVDRISREGDKFVLELSGTTTGRQVFDDVIVAVPASMAAPLAGPLVPGLGEKLAAIRYVSTATVSLAYLLEDIPADRPLDGFGVMIPARENRKIVACTWASTKFKHRAPPGCVLLRAFVGGYRNENLVDQDEAALIEMVKREYAELFGIAAQPIKAHVFKWIKGNPQYDVGHLDRVAEMERLAATVPGLYLAGSSYHGIGMPDCIKSALKAVDRIIPGSIKTVMGPALR